MGLDMLKFCASISLVIAILFSCLHADDFQIKGLADRLEPHKREHKDAFYAIYARPKGALGEKLSIYWDAIESSRELRHKKIVDTIPSHCCLTTFFKGKHPESFYIDAFEWTLSEFKKKSHKIHIIDMVQEKKSDFIELHSTFLFEFAKFFADIADVNLSHVRNPNVHPYKILLRNCQFKNSKKLKKIRKLEDQIKLDVRVRWTVVLYRKLDGHLRIIKEFRL